MNSQPNKTAILVIDGLTEPSSQPQLMGTRSLLPLVDKPMLQLAIELLINQGCQEFHVLLGEQPTTVQAFLDNGERWGIQITYHYSHADLDLATNLKPLALTPEKNYWLICPNKLPTDLSELCRFESLHFSGAALCWRSEDRVHWSGWGCFTGAWLASVRIPLLFTSVEQIILDHDHLSLQLTVPPLSVTTDAEFLQSSLQILKDRSAASGQSVSVSRTAVVHPSVEIIGPVHIGKHARIEAGVRLGPNVIICDGSVIDHGAELEDSIVLPDTYVGPQLELNGSIAAPATLSSIANHVVMRLIEPGYLASVSGRGVISQTSNYSFISILLIKTLLLPLWLLAWLVSQMAGLKAPEEKTMRILGPASDNDNANDVQINAANTLSGIYLDEEGAWVTHFLHTFHAGLNELARGPVALCGLELRAATDVAQLPEYWKSLYRQHKCGLLSESILLPTEAASQSDRYACDAYAVMDRSSRYQLRLLIRYLGHVLTNCGTTLFRAGQKESGPISPSNPK